MNNKDVDKSLAAMGPPGDAMPTTAEKVSTVEELESKGTPVQVQDEAWLAAEKSLVRKLDFTLVPMIWILYMFNYLDRNNIA